MNRRILGRVAVGAFIIACLPFIVDAIVAASTIYAPWIGQMALLAVALGVLALVVRARQPGHPVPDDEPMSVEVAPRAATPPRVPCGSA